MPQARGHRFTIYDALDAAGLFEANPANTFARDATTGQSLYAGPVQFPKMMYHPTGATEVSRAGEVVVNPLTGPALQNEHREMIHQIVGSQEEEDALAAEGWHTHPALAIRARVEAAIESDEKMSEAEKAKLRKAIPQISSDDRIRQLEKQLAEAQAQRDAMEARVGVPLRQVELP